MVDPKFTNRDALVVSCETDHEIFFDKKIFMFFNESFQKGYIKLPDYIAIHLRIQFENP